MSLLLQAFWQEVGVEVFLVFENTARSRGRDGLSVLTRSSLEPSSPFLHKKSWDYSGRYGIPK